MNKANSCFTSSQTCSGFVAVCAAALLLVACGGGGHGKYYWGEGGQGITLELKGDGVAVVTLTGFPPTVGTYSIDGDKVTVVMNNDIDIYTMKDGDLTSRELGEEVIFVKQ